MFTGIIEEVGKVARILHRNAGLKLSIEADTVLSDLKIGDSIAVDGVCVTVTRLASHSFEVDVVTQTLQNSTLGKLRIDQLVNLERAVKPSDRLGGHIITGHIDGVGRVDSREDYTGESIFRISIPSGLLRYLVRRCSISVNGISLTVAELYDAGFSVSIIPHTLKTTNLNLKKVDDILNIEVDLIGKYIERYCKTYLQGENKITFDFLERTGCV